MSAHQSYDPNIPIIVPVVSTPSLKMHWKYCQIVWLAKQRVEIRIHAVNLHWHHHRHHHKLNRNIGFDYFYKSVSKSANPEIEKSNACHRFSGVIAFKHLCNRTSLLAIADQIMDHKSQILAAVPSIKRSNHRELCDEPNIFSPFDECEIPPQRRVDLDLNWPWRWRGV